MPPGKVGCLELVRSSIQGHHRILFRAAGLPELPLDEFLPEISAAAALRRGLAREVGLKITEVPSEVGVPPVESLSPRTRHDLMQAASVLLQQWPARFLAICEGEGVWGSAVRRDWEDSEAIPFAFADPIRSLDRTFYVPNEAEVESIRQYLIWQGLRPTAHRMRNLTGIDSKRFSVRECRAERKFPPF
jgi:hypothetical protein